MALAAALLLLSVWTDAGDSYELDVVSPSCQTHPMPGQCYDTTSSNTAAGAWSIPQAQVAPSVASLEAQVTALQTRLGVVSNEAVRWQNAANSYQAQATSYLRGHANANATIANQNAALVQLKLNISWLNAQVATCRAHKGVC